MTRTLQREEIKMMRRERRRDRTLRTALYPVMPKPYLSMRSSQFTRENVILVQATRTLEYMNKMRQNASHTKSTPGIGEPM